MNVRLSITTALAGAVLGSALFAASASAESIRLCPYIYAGYTDNGHAGEDYYTTDWYRSIDGVVTRVKRNGTTLWTGALQDVSGASYHCTPWLTVSAGTANFTLEFYSYSVMNDTGNIVWVLPPSGGFPELISATQAYTPAGQTLFPMVSPPGVTTTRRLFQTLAAATYALEKNNNGHQNEWYIYHNEQSSLVCGTCYQGDGHIYLGGTRPDDKFVITHETGHATANRRFGPKSSTGGECGTHDPLTDSFASCEVEGTTSGHSMRSMENQKCTFAEGFAHFYSAITWNNTSQYGCKYEYYKPTLGDPSPAIDCYSDTSSNPPYEFQNRVMENRCVAHAVDWRGHGTELDWLRALFYIRAGGYYGASFDEIMDWIGSADTWTAHYAWKRLDEAAATAPWWLETNWAYASQLHGIDWEIGL